MSSYLPFIYPRLKGTEHSMILQFQVHSYLKINHRYTLGFTVGLLKAQQELLARVYADARRHFYDWDNLKILGAYEQVRTSAEEPAADGKEQFSSEDHQLPEFGVER